MIRRMGRLYGQSADDYGQSANDDIPTGVSALESADSELEPANSAKVGVWVWAFRGVLNVCVAFRK